MQTLLCKPPERVFGPKKSKLTEVHYTMERPRFVQAVSFVLLGWSHQIKYHGMSICLGQEKHQMKKEFYRGKLMESDAHNTVSRMRV
jgi:hypothetical protein